jgi:hypothetical protein
MARTGDPDFSGNKAVKFDDTRTVIFNDNVTVSYPTLLQPAGQYLKFITESIASPNSGSDILATGAVRKGIADQFVRFDNSESIGPFKEHQRAFPNEGDFYLTGTDPNVLPDFSSRLGSKTVIKIPLTVKTESAVYWSTGTLNSGPFLAWGAKGLDEGVRSGLSYFNTQAGEWEVVGVDQSTTTANKVDYLARTYNLLGNVNGADGTTGQRDSTYLAVMGSGVSSGSYIIDVPDKIKDQIHKLTGIPSDQCGFPIDERFSASSEQSISLQQFISSPFALEKAIFVFSGSINLLNFEPTREFSPHRATVGVMCQRGLSDKSTFSSQRRNIRRQDNTSPFPDVMVESGYSHTTTIGEKIRDVVAFGRIQSVGSELIRDQLTNTQKAELNLVVQDQDEGITGSFVLPMTSIQLPLINDSNMFFPLTGKRRPMNAVGSPPTLEEFAFEGWGGGRNSINLSSNNAGRSLKATVIGQKIADQFTYPLFNDSSPTSIGSITVELADFDPLSTPSPYVLNPTDELIFFCANQPKDEFVSVDSNGNDLEADFANKYRVNFASGESYVLLIGSQIRDGKEFHDTSNQPLNSDAVHEALHYDNPTVDQFQVEAQTSYTGTYIDDIVSGDFNAGTRGVIGSSAAGTQGITGSLLRGVRTVDNRERFYDTVLPTPLSYHLSDGYSIEQNRINVAGSGDWGTDVPGANTIWFYSYPFESRYSFLDRNLLGNPLKTQGANEVLEGIQLWVSSTDPAVSVRNGLISDQFDLALNSNTLLKFWFGSGNGNTDAITSFYSDDGVKLYPNNAPDIAISPTQNFIPSIRGFKYGIKNALPEFSSLVTRYDRYGQFRDMLEQRPDSRFSTGETTTDAPVTVKFVSRNTDSIVSPTVTTSSNKSEFATSSLPYFDGVARN